MRLFMLDTDTVRYLIRGKSAALDAHVAGTAPKRLCISAVTRGELLYGVQLKPGAHKLAQLVDQVLTRLVCLPWDTAAAAHFAEVAAALHLGGLPIGSMDAMIAGHAKAVGAVLITNNTRHFSRVAGLVVENWTLARV